MQQAITLTVNGSTFNTPVADGEPLIHVLRDRLGFTGPRFGCGAEACGACMVLVDDKPAYSCTLEARTLGAAHVTTVEGLGLESALHPVQRALLQHQAGQCGYCLSGIVVSAAALLADNPSPTRDQIVQALDRHLCRCGAHLRIIAAIETAVVMMQEDNG